MAALNFFDGFKSAWAQDGGVFGWTQEQYRTGWAVIGDTKPSVEQFNNVHQVIDQKANYLYRQLKTAADDRSVSTAAGKDDTLKELLDKLKTELMETQYPVGCVEIMTNATTPAQRGLPGTWEKITDGFLYAHGAPQAGSVGSTGGNASIKLSVAQLPAHNHSMGSAGNHTHSTSSAGSHTHTRGSMNITGSFGARRTGEVTTGIVVSNEEGAFSAGGHPNVGTAIERLATAGVSQARSRTSFNAASSWTGSTSSAGSHTHSINSAGAHTHSINNTGDGASINIIPPRLTVYMWKRVS